MPTSGSFLNQMRALIGVREIPYGSNRTTVGIAFGWNGVAWCAETVSVAAKRAGLNWWTASTDVMEAWARHGINGSRWIPANGAPRPGDICVWDFKRDGTANHVSVVEVVRPDGKLVTIGGNESNRCQRAVRSKTALRGYVRLPFTGTVATKPKPPTHSPRHPTLQIGNKGVAVKELQSKLRALRVANLTLDGKFGPATKKAVVGFQRFFKLKADGIAGPKTWALVDYLYAIKNGN